jgi:hypothetical protein
MKFREINFWLGIFCSNSFENQHRFKLFQSHKKTNLSEVSPKCINHQNKPSELFCFTDESFICSHCEIFKHKEHDCVGLEEAKKIEKFFKFIFKR